MAKEMTQVTFGSQQVAVIAEGYYHRFRMNPDLDQVDGRWQQTLVQTNTLAFAQQLLPRKLRLTQGQGPLSTLLQQLEAGLVLRFDVVQDAQSALYLPTPLGARL
ncbi:hypothetical protein [Gallaecimonas xiamenensis]|uniref:Uncharacterized protein n=1 Tax=Gallaecimonas xiamenensis 3-C-1 TaxID=745411 RepID=K2JU56_9GAMM|nr:hypothetical protein [Gallaecimonas xiamenensis]EKE73934.1 hypothetical protein B3C1_08953 [Gallaecimonas xiamenensis 3-C-1]